MLTLQSTAKFNQKVAIVLLTKDQLKNREFNFNNAPLREAVARLFQAGQFTGGSAEIFPVAVGKCLVILVGLGEQNKLSLTELRIRVRTALRSTYLSKVESLECIPHDNQSDSVIAAIEGVLLGGYEWNKYLSAAKKDIPIAEKNIVLIAPSKPAFEEAIAICEGVNSARDLVNENADIVTAEYIEKNIKDLIKGRKNISVEILGRKEMKQKGLGLHLAVNQGSVNEPKLVIVRYTGAPDRSDYTALVGKGMTFDTGGLNLKPTGSIESMRCDMSGAATVVGVLKNVLNLQLKRNVIFAVGLAENSIDAASYKPGDVFRGYAGKTVEIGNTDAEGRLVLADAISYVVKNYKPNRIIDIATLTGACVVALGHDYTGLISNDQDLAQKLLRWAQETDDRSWQLPNYPEIKEQVKSRIADLYNIGTIRGAGGACTAAEFLRQFTEDTPWAHLDIAGTAFVSAEGRMYFGHGATGAGVRLLTHYLMHD